MPTFTWYVGAPGGAAAHGSARRASYAFTPTLDPATRDFVMDGSVWRPGDPLTEVVLLTLWTPKGSYAPDPTLGPDYGVLLTQTPNLAATWKAEVEGALARYVRRGRLSDLRVDADPPLRGRLVYAVTYTDPRAAARRPTTLRLVA